MRGYSAVGSARAALVMARKVDAAQAISLASALTAALFLALPPAEGEPFALSDVALQNDSIRIAFVLV
jgi:hypothetical protein